ncbi:MAG TPA: MFS transporter [Actinomycetota bacterium]|nr:MFS transporter [Actinomycetota bacterium]
MLRRGIALLFENRDFRSLMGAQFFAQAGDGLVQVALAASIVFGGQKGFDLEGAKSPDDLLRIALYIFVPYTVVSPFLGVVIDRWDRRRLLMVANAFRAGVIGIIALAGVDGLPDAVVFGAFLLTLSSTRVVLATKSAAVPDTLQGSSLVEANAVSQLGGALFQLGGAGIALIAKKYLDAEPIVLAGALVYLVGALFPLAMKRMDPDRARTSFGAELAHVARSIMQGFREVARTPKAGASITTYFWLRFLWSFTLVGIGFTARELLADDDLQVAVFTGGAGAVGAALGFLFASKLLQRVRSTAQLVLSASTVAGLAVALLGALEMKLSIAVLAFFLGLGFFLAKISLDSLVQEALGADFRGRAFSLYDIAYNLAWVLAAGIMKVAWSDDVKGALLAGAGIVFLLGIAALGAWFKRAGLLRTAEAPAAAR